MVKTWVPRTEKNHREMCEIVMGTRPATRHVFKKRIQYNSLQKSVKYTSTPSVMRMIPTLTLNTDFNRYEDVLNYCSALLVGI